MKTFAVFVYCAIGGELIAEVFYPVIGLWIIVPCVLWGMATTDLFKSKAP